MGEDDSKKSRLLSPPLSQYLHKKCRDVLSTGLHLGSLPRTLPYHLESSSRRSLKYTVQLEFKFQPMLARLILHALRQGSRMLSTCQATSGRWAVERNLLH